MGIFSTRKTKRSFFTKLVALILGGSFLSALVPTFFHHQGIDSPHPIGAFMNGNLPSTTPGGVTSWDVVEAFPNLTFANPITMAPEPNSNRLHVGQRDGKVYFFNNDSTTSAKTTFLDISDRVAVVNDGGLISMAFHPRFGLDSNYVYFYYCARVPNASYPTTSQGYGYPGNFFNIWGRLSRFAVDPVTHIADPNSELIMINKRLYNGSHRGGAITFDKDGFLFVALGDEFRYETAQTIDTLLEGGVLRIDVDRDPTRSHAPIRTLPIGNADEYSGIGYYIPNDNPWLDPTGNKFEEYYSIGHRQPHRMTYDSINDQLWIGEVGGNKREEINVVAKGGNFGHPFREGFLVNGKTPPDPILGTITDPVIDFPHSETAVIIGGYVYRGSDLPYFQGKYICGGYAQDKLWAIDYDPVAGATKELICNFYPERLCSFGIDHSGELYMIQQGANAGIYKIAPLGAAPTAPALLSQVGAFKNLSTMEPQDGVLPYELIEPFWSDNAEKFRWMMIPNDGTHDTPAEQITYSEEGDWDFPIGAVLIKHFEMVLDESNPSNRKKLETRFMVHGSDGKYYGLTYKWRADQSDADLLFGADTDTFTVATTIGGMREETWEFPARDACLSCHNQAAKSVLGPITRQLNNKIFYPSTGRTAHQLITLEHLGIFSPSIDTSAAHLSSILTAKNKYDTLASLDERARTYLDANCSSCHRAGTGNRAFFDSRMQIPLEAQGYLYGDVNDEIGIFGGKVIIPGDIDRSILFQRLNDVHSGIAMPPLAKNKIDSAGVDLIKEWILNLDPQTPAEGSGLLGTYYDDKDFTDQKFTRVDNEIDFYWGGGSPDPAMDDNSWSVSWTGQILPLFNETYTFSTIASDGVRLYVDGQLVIDKWFNQAPAEWSGSIALTAGVKTDITLEYYKQSGTSLVELYWESETQEKGIIPSRYLFPNTAQTFNQAICLDPIENQLLGAGPFNINTEASSGLEVNLSVESGPATINGHVLTLTGGLGKVTIRASQPGNATYRPAPEIQTSFFVYGQNGGQGNGLLGTYFDNNDLTSPVLQRVDDKIDFDWGSGSPAGAVDLNTYSVRWEGEIEAPFSENFTFLTNSDDGVRLWIDNTLIIDQWGTQSLSTHSGTASMTAGQRVPIKLEYLEENAYSLVNLSWSSPSISLETVPRRFLYTSHISAYDDYAQYLDTNPVAIDVLSNDSLPVAADLSTLTVVDEPWHGTASVDQVLGVINYQAKLNQPDRDQFTYRFKDQNGIWSSVATVYLRPVSGCDVPQGRNVISVGENSAQLGWSVVDSAISYEVRYRQVGAPSWNAPMAVATNQLTLNGLTSATDYEWQVRTLCNGQNSDWSPTGNFITDSPPATCDIPQGRNVISVDETFAEVGWTQVDPTVSYELRYRMTGATSWNTPIPTPAIQLNLNGLTADTDYEWQVRTICASLNSSWSASSNFTTNSAPPSACDIPQGRNIISVGEDSALVGWALVDSAVSYEVQYRTVGTTSWNAPLTTAASQLSLNGLSPATGYEWQVRSLCASQNTGWSASAFFTTYGQGGPGCNPLIGWNPQDIGAVNTPGSACDSSGIIRLQGTGLRIKSTTDEFFYVYKNLPADGEIVARVLSLNSSDNSNDALGGIMIRSDLDPGATFWSMLVEVGNTVRFRRRTKTGSFAAATNTTGAAPIWLKLSRTGNQISGYHSLDGITWTQLGPTPGQANGPLLVGLAIANGNNIGIATMEFDNIGFQGVGTPSTCDIPQGLNALSIGEDSAQVTWSAVASAASYEVQFRPTGASSWNAPMSSSANQLTLNGLTPGTAYEWQVRTNCSGQNSSWSTANNFTTSGSPQTCDVPQGLNLVSVGENSAQVAWAQVDPTVSYEVQYRTAGSTSWNAPLSASGIQLTLSGLTAATVYEWQVKTICPNLNSAWSTASNFTTDGPPPVACDIPQGLTTISTGEDSAQVTWAVASSAVSYEVQYREIGAPSWHSPIATTGNQLVLSGLTNSTAYEWQVRSVCANDNSAWSTTSNFTTHGPGSIGCDPLLDWTTQDIGAVSTPGTACDSAGIIKLSGTGSRIKSTADEFFYVYKSLPADGEIVARILSLNSSDNSNDALGGIMIRSALDPGSTFWSMLVELGGNVRFGRRTNTGGFAAATNSSGSAPIWLKLVRTGKRVKGYYSLDGENWTQLGPRIGQVTGPLMVGLAIANGNNSGIATMEFDNISFQGVGTPSSCDIPQGQNVLSFGEDSALVTWATVGSAVSYEVQYRPTGTASWGAPIPTPANQLTLGNLAPGTGHEWQVRTVCAGQSSGWSISNFFTTSGSLATCDIPQGKIALSVGVDTARVGWNVVDPTVSYEVQYRPTGSTSWSSPIFTATNQLTLGSLIPETAYDWEVRTICSGLNSAWSTTSNFTTNSPPPAACDIPEGLTTISAGEDSALVSWALADSALSFELQYRTVGAPSWNSPIGTADIQLVLSGLTPSTAYEWQVRSICNSENSAWSASSNFTTQSSGGIGCNPVTGWTPQEIGAVSTPGAACDSSGIIRISGTGLRIKSTADELFYVYQSLPADGEIVARVLNLSSSDNSNDALGGIMIRSSVDPGSTFWSMLLEVGNTVRFRRRTKTGSYAAATNTIGSTPIWFKLVRTGNQISGYYSPDGTSWTQLGPTPGQASGPLLVGLAIANGNNIGIATMEFDNIVITNNSAKQALSIAPEWEVKASPNPFSTNFILEATENTPFPMALTLFDVKGKIVESWIWADPSGKKIPGGNLANGVYYLRAESKNQSQWLKLIKLE
jgi:uncharacterized repeat protein (TIGR03806 family)